MTDTHTASAGSLFPAYHSPAARRLRRWRHIKDIATSYLMGLGGVSVIIAIVLIAFYLLYVVLPMFRPAQIELAASYEIPGDRVEETLYYALEEQREIGLRVSGAGLATFFNTKDGTLVQEVPLLAETSAEVTSFSAGDPSQSLLTLGLGDGTALLARHRYQVTYPNDVRLITPGIERLFGSEPLIVDESGYPLKMISAQSDGEQTTIAAVTDDDRLLLVNLEREESMFEEQGEITRTDSLIPLKHPIDHLILDIEQRELYFADKTGFVYFYDVSDKAAPRLVQAVRAVPEGVRITSLKFLSGGISILVGDSRGEIAQWFPVRDRENNYTLEKIRYFDSLSAPITDIAPEYFRKGFITIDETGRVGLYHTTAHRTVKLKKIHQGPLGRIAIAPRANAALVEDDQGRLQFLHLNNEHPEISWQSIWGKVWYESRDRPAYIWQSSSASSDFEPKFSLTPLAFGTLKAAFYAMLFAIPLAILGAIYTAYFMSPRMRGMVKPTIEIMEALPTVILGFLAGLWFAPFAELHMPGLFLIFLSMPMAIIIAAYLWRQLPAVIRHLIPDGWEAALLMPVVIVTIVVCLLLSQPLELWLFDGNMPLWLTNKGIDFDQRNSLVVGIAMGFAVIPTIFSISEDAIYSVPKQLTTGSLALGATAWQTMVRVVLLTASPGIFSAIMIGIGRAVGETMIVVMATGNTAIMDMNIFQGFRALSANIAVEMPESEVGSTHYRILFLAGLVLFLATFIFNTAAELVRQRLRAKYSSL